MKYQVAIPKPSAKRLKKGILVITLESGWEVYPSRTYDLVPEQASFEFEVEDPFDYVYDTSVIDGNVFNVYVEYSNDSGSRKEKYSLVPMRIK